MTHTTVTLPYGQDTVSVSVPTANLIGVHSPKDIPPVPDVRAEILRAIQNPLGTAPLAQLLRGAKNAVIVA